VVTAPQEAPGTARYRLTIGADPVTIIGAPRLSARIDVEGLGPANAQIAARLWDISADGQSQRLIARGVYRPSDGLNNWELHPAAWRVQQGHAVELELLGNDAPSYRRSNGTFQATISDLKIRLPVR
jgi:hypothetical protein